MRGFIYAILKNEPLWSKNFLLDFTFQHCCIGNQVSNAWNLGSTFKPQSFHVQSVTKLKIFYFVYLFIYFLRTVGFTDVCNGPGLSRLPPFSRAPGMEIVIRGSLCWVWVRQWILPHSVVLLGWRGGGAHSLSHGPWGPPHCCCSKTYCHTR